MSTEALVDEVQSFWRDELNLKKNDMHVQVLVFSAKQVSCWDQKNATYRISKLFKNQNLSWWKNANGSSGNNIGSITKKHHT